MSSNGNDTAPDSTAANNTSANDTVRDFWLGRSGVNETAAAPAEIQQDELAHYQALKAASREMERLRESIRERLQRGATVEHGPLRAWVRTSESRRFSQAALASIIGEPAMRDLRERLPFTMSNQLIIE